jgi:hypothetical protein
MKRRRRKRAGLGYNRGGMPNLSRESKAFSLRIKASARKKCSMFQKRVNEAMIDVPSSRFQPLFFHVISLAEDAAARGNCKQAYREIGQAKRIGRKYRPSDD